MKYQITATIYTNTPLPEAEQLELRDTVLHSLMNNPNAKFVKISMEEEKTKLTYDQWNRIKNIIEKEKSLLSEKQLTNLDNWIKKQKTKS